VIGGLIVDVMVVAAVLAFVWAGRELGGRVSLARVLASYAAFVTAVLVRDPAGTIIEAALGTSIDFSRLVGTLIAGVAAYLAVNSIVVWWFNKRRAAAEGSEDDDALAREPDWIDDSRFAAFGGGLLGLGWVATFVAVLVLLPADRPFASAAINSNTGGLLIRQEEALRWFAEGFPHYTQTLPKGKEGAVVGERDSIPMRGDDEPVDRPEDSDVLLNAVNDLRRSARVRTLAFNPDVAAVARRHALALAADHRLSYETPGGGKIDDRVASARGEASGAFDDDAGIEVVWAHSPANAGVGLIQSRRASKLLSDPKWTEVGIGVADAGWFDGRVYVLLLVGPIDTEGAADSEEISESGDQRDDGAADASGEALELDPGSASEGSSEETCTSSAIDLDGDGVPDPQSVDPALDECPQDTETVE